MPSPSAYLVELLAITMLSCSFACSEPLLESEPDDAGGGGAGGAAESPSPSPPPEECPLEETIMLTSQQYDGETIALYAPVEVEATPGLFHVDTASLVTFLLAPDAGLWVEDYAKGSLGCRERSFPGRGGLGSLPDVDGLPVLGVAGADLFLQEPVLLDVEGARFIRNPSDLALVAEGTDLPYEVVGGVYVVDAMFDGEPVRLILDTGAGHSVWVNETPRPGEVELTTVDSLGNPLTVYQSTVELAVGGEVLEVTLLRAPVFDVVAALSEAMGVHIDGLIGLSALNALYSDEANGVLRAAL
jgi:hypothetical protein